MTRNGSTTVKVILGVALGLVACLALAVYIWWHNTGGPMYEQVTGAMRDGRALGGTLAASACVDTVVARHGVAVAARPAGADSAAPDLKGLMSEPMFFTGCLMAAKPSPELCAAVPQRADRTRAREWATEQCSKRHVSDAACPALVLGPLQAYCGRAQTGLSS